MLHETRPKSLVTLPGRAEMHVALLGVVLLLGGCSSSDTVPPPHSSQFGQRIAPTLTNTDAAASGAVPTRSQGKNPTTASGLGTSMRAAGGGQEAPQVAGSLLGQIASVSSASMEVVVGRAATKVTWSADTNFRMAQASKAIGVKKGVCIVAAQEAKIPGGDAAGDDITGLVLSDPISGVCADSADTFGGARVVSGLVTSVKGMTVAVQTKGVGRPVATVNLVLAKNVGVAKMVNGSARDAVRGRCVAVSGIRQPSGVFVATSITVSKPGFSGCRA